MRSLRLPFALLSAAALAAGAVACDLQKTADQLQADRVMVATLLSTPPIEIRPSFLNPDGGFGLDGGFELDGGVEVDGGVGVTLPAQTAAFVFFGTKEPGSLEAAPGPISNAEVTLRPNSGTPFTLDNEGEGNYSKTGSSEDGVTYASGATYDFIARHEGVEFIGRVEEVPELEEIPEFHPANGFVSHPANTAFTFTRPPAPADRERNLGFLTVFPVGANGERGEPSYTNIPDEPLEFLQLIALPATFKTNTVTIPGSAFPQKDATYVAVFQAVKTGGPESGNLFSGSALLAGTAEIGIFRTR